MRKPNSESCHRVARPMTFAYGSRTSLCGLKRWPVLRRVRAVDAVAVELARAGRRAGSRARPCRCARAAGSSATRISASAESNRQSSTRVACSEKIAKLTPTPSQVAPSGCGAPGQTRRLLLGTSHDKYHVRGWDGYRRVFALLNRGGATKHFTAEVAEDAELDWWFSAPSAFSAVRGSRAGDRRPMGRQLKPASASLVGSVRASHPCVTMDALRRWAVLLDSAFKVPGTKIRFGLDAISGSCRGWAISSRRSLR